MSYIGMCFEEPRIGLCMECDNPIKYEIYENQMGISIYAVCTNDSCLKKTLLKSIRWRDLHDIGFYAKAFHLQ